MAEALLRGDIVAAWTDNPLLLVVAVLIGIRSLGWLVELVGHPQAPSRHWLPASWSRHWIGAFVVVSAAYVLVRNLFGIS
jgi:hypothetical protein